MYVTICACCQQAWMEWDPADSLLSRLRRTTRTNRHTHTKWFKSPSGTSELDSATNTSDTAERSISIGRESLQVLCVCVCVCVCVCMCVLGAMAYLRVSPLGDSRDETWRGQRIGKRSVSWNLPKLSQLWRCNGRFVPCTTQNHLRTKQFVSGTWNSSRVAGCSCAAKRTGWPGPSAETVERVRETFVRGPQKSSRVDISNTCKVGQKLGVSLPLLTCSTSAWPSRLRHRRGRKSRRDLWLTLYILLPPND
jgi:hypothetical protein